MDKTIFDIGANNGDDVAYYILKASKVVAVEANPDLCEVIEARFADSISTGKLVVESCVVTARDQGETVAFHVHIDNHVLSRRTAPLRRRDRYRRVELPAKSLAKLIAEHGCPDYVKIDIEGGEDDLVRALFRLGVHPRHISVEAHRIEAFLRIAASGEYDRFQIVEGEGVSATFRDHPIAVEDGQALHSFPPHSAGPYGEDLGDDWVDAEDLFARLMAEGLGWKDVHARRRVGSAAPLPSPARRMAEWVFRWWRWYRRSPLRRIREVVSNS
ncbi:MAG: FkbM family methyltransferase [Armatimonadota bacterium]